MACGRTTKTGLAAWVLHFVQDDEEEGMNEVFLLLFVHKKKTFFSEVIWAPTPVRKLAPATGVVRRRAALSTAGALA